MPTQKEWLPTARFENVIPPFVQFCQTPTLSTRHHEDEIPAGLEAVNANSAVLEVVGLEGAWVSETLGADDTVGERVGAGFTVHV